MIVANLDDLTICNDYTYSLNGQPFTGIAREFNSDGILISETTLINGSQEGIERIWFPSGQLKSTTEFRGNQIHGIYKEFYESGELSVNSDFEFGICVRRKIYDTGGTLKEDWSVEISPKTFAYLQSIRQRHLASQSSSKVN